MVVVRTGARCPLKSLSLTLPSVVFKHKESVKSARKNLFGSHTSENLKLASTLLQSSANLFASRWNFDPISEKPLPGGRFSWKLLEPVVPKQEPFSICRSLDTLSCFLSTYQEPNGVQTSVDAGARMSHRTAGLPQGCLKDNPKEETPIHSDVSPLCTFSPTLTPLIKGLNLRSEPSENEECPPLLQASKNGDSCILTSNNHCSSLQSSNIVHNKTEKRGSESLPSGAQKKLKQTKITDYGRIMKPRKKEELKHSLSRRSPNIRLLM